MVKGELFPLLDWMANLKSLSLIKLKRQLIKCLEIWDHFIRPLLLQDLLNHIFRDGGFPSSLQRLWIHQFYCDALGNSQLINKLLWGRATPEPLHMTSYYFQGDGLYLDIHHEQSERLNQLEHLVLYSFESSVEVNNPRQIILPKLKYLRADSCEHPDIQAIRIIDHGNFNYEFMFFNCF